MQRYEGECHCGRVRFELEGPPMAAFCCHCTVCRRSIGCPYILVGMWQPERARIAKGAPLLERTTSPWLTRHRCPDCGAAIYNAVSTKSFVASNFMLPLLLERDDAVRPTHHIFYADRMVDIDDGLPKFDALPPH
jgi:hypothetical protein